MVDGNWIDRSEDLDLKTSKNIVKPVFQHMKTGQQKGRYTYAKEIGGCSTKKATKTEILLTQTRVVINQGVDMRMAVWRTHITWGNLSMIWIPELHQPTPGLWKDELLQSHEDWRVPMSSKSLLTLGQNLSAGANPKLGELAHLYIEWVYIYIYIYIHIIYYICVYIYISRAWLH